MMTPETAAYVARHGADDVRLLALRGTKDPLVDLPLALDQIAGRQKARQKLPSWADVEGLCFPPHLAMEQCSSETTARYKAALVARAVAGRDRLTDLTGGFGVDFSFLAPLFRRAVYVERQQQLCLTARHNMPLLGIAQAEVVCDEAEHYAAHSMEHCSLVFIDPARRDSHGQRTYALTDCTPDATTLMPLLLRKSDAVLLKLSPMLDWRKAVADVGAERVSEVHIVATGGECKELLLLAGQEARPLTLHCADDSGVVVLSADELSPMPPTAGGAVPEAGWWLCEPSAPLMKSGCFAAIEHRYGVTQIAPSSHLFVASEPVKAFPGRTFRIGTVTTMAKGALKKALSGTDRANIAVRNFPLGVNELRKRLHMADGGDVYIFATTLADGQHVLLVCTKFGQA